jgi:hypothetical protein
MASRTGDDKFLAGSTRCSIITRATAKPPDTTRRSVTEAKSKKPKLEEVVDASFPRCVRESNRLARELLARERDSSSFSIRIMKSRDAKLDGKLACQARNLNHPAADKLFIKKLALTIITGFVERRVGKIE